MGKGKKSAPKDKKSKGPAAKKAGHKYAGVYAIEGDKLKRKNVSCPKSGTGVFMANHKDRRTCGKCGYMEKIVAKKE